MIERILKNHSNINYNLMEFNKIANLYHKKYGVMTYSGTLAILSILEYEKFEDYIIIPNNTCFRIILPLIKNKNKVVIVNPKNGFFVSSQEYVEIIENLKKENIKISAIIIPYIDGVLIDLKKIRDSFDGIIIEDIALVYKNENIGLYSDYVVTSYGSYKAIELGYGGALFTNRIKPENIFDFEKYEGIDIPLPYAYQKRLKISITEEMEKTKKREKRNIKIAKLLSLIKNKNIEKESDYIENSIEENYWSKFSIKIKNKDKDRITDILNKCNVIYQIKKQKDKLNNIEIIKNYKNKILFNSEEKDEIEISIRTDENKIRNIKSLIKKLNEMEY